MRPAHFFLAPRLSLVEKHQVNEEIPWEIVEGRLLEPRHATRRHKLESWSLFLVDDSGPSEEPALSVKLDAQAGELHVTRAIFSHAWEAYDAGANVILSRESKRWVRELAGTIALERIGNVEDLRDELACRLFLAVVGSSRLPLTSVEAPLPAYSLGELAYFYRPRPSADELAGPPARTWHHLIAMMWIDELAWRERAKLLETLLHATPELELDAAVDTLLARWCLPREPVDLLRTLFNEASLSPYTDLVDKSLAFLECLERKGLVAVDERVDFLAHLLRQLSRHLTAYDLVTFHHRGANYPDALLLDAVLKTYLGLAGGRPSLFLPIESDSEIEAKRKRLRRRALRQGWLLRRRYEGHLVPDAPTSQGENARVLPPPHSRVPEEQIINPHRRNRRLYDADPLDAYLTAESQAILARSVADLDHPDELCELGMAIFLDRPLGAGKGPREPNSTPLLSYLAFSRSIARCRVKLLAETLGLIPDRNQYDRVIGMLDSGLEVTGLRLADIVTSPRPGCVSLADAAKVADDFLFLQTTGQTAATFFKLPGLEELSAQLFRQGPGGPVLIARVPSTSSSLGWTLAVFDRNVNRRVELDFDPRLGYASRAGLEYPVSGFRVRFV
jgi:hypothetical protein